MATRVAVLCDIHGLLPALEAVLAEVEQAGVDLIVFGGDVAAGPMPIETIDLLVTYRGRARFVRGNADRAMVETYDAPGRVDTSLSGWPARQLTRAHRDFLNGFGLTVDIDIDGLGSVLCCHAGPLSDEVPIITSATPDAVIAEALATTDASLVVAGHTHMQFDRTVQGRRMINAGSIGMPYANQPGAYWLLLGPGVDLRRTVFDFDLAAEAVRRTEFPQRKNAAANVIKPPSEEEATTVFEHQAGRSYPA